MRPLAVAYRGNFAPPHSTESHVAASLELLGHRVVRVQEDRCSWADTEAACAGCDLLLWTQTYGYALAWDRADAFGALARIGGRMPTVGFHLDRWWDLDRQAQVRTEPFFQATGWLFTADGDNDERWAEAGVRHRWSPPACYGPECVPGMWRADLACDVAFVGSWNGYGHPEWWPQRRELLRFLRRRYGRRFRCWPEAGRSAVRGADLNDVYASAKVAVGDSCFADRSRRYISDRAFEAPGRGGLSVMPHVADIAGMLADGEHCWWYDHGDWDRLAWLIDRAVADADENARVRKAGQEHVATHHTYADRMGGLLATVAAEDGLDWLVEGS